MTRHHQFTNDTEGATDHAGCFYSTCKHEPLCSVCGWGEHAAIHGPLFGQPVGSKPWGHKYRPATSEGKPGTP